MKFLFPILLLVVTRVSAQPPLIHAHNDYQKTEPLIQAIRYKVYAIEADVYLVDHKLRVCHDESATLQAPTLGQLYLQPIIQLFNKYRGRISEDSTYAPVLMIDIKKDGTAVLQEILKEIAQYPQVFDRGTNPLAVQVVISGDRGPVDHWAAYPSTILFDGRPREHYDTDALQKVAFVSDAYANYFRPADSIDIRLQSLARAVHQKGKILRLWGIPDNPKAWDHFKNLGIDIINTDSVAACRAYFGYK
ncbi:MAG: glycerophosphodiester phosphodiesterase [Terrimonas sp.]|nr:glycerophosphodiester phosphodiesterase [Terrimonas sp.]